MKRVGPKEIFDGYANRFKTFEKYQLDSPIEESIAHVIVIPCYNEPNLLDTLKSLENCTVPQKKMEIIIVVNQSENATDEINHRNLETIKEFDKWRSGKSFRNLDFRLIKALDLPQKKAGVGLARKIGMDEACRRLSDQNKLGWIVCLDADCIVSKDYLLAIENNCSREVFGGHFYFEHQLAQAETEELQKGILLYELHLRYYAQALKFSGFKYWHHTVGSCMMVRSDIYAKSGGMNQRKAGEDFYFMHKILPYGNSVNISEATVFPSSRISDRVPFGTGKAQGDWIVSKNRDRLTYAFSIFHDLKLFFESFHYWFNDTPTLNKRLEVFLESIKFKESVIKIRNRSRGLDVFIQNLERFCDGFFVLKMVHFLRDEYHGEQELKSAANQLLQSSGYKESFKTDLELLEKFRFLDKYETSD